MKRFEIRLPDELFNLIPGNRSDFIRKAIECRLNETRALSISDLDILKSKLMSSIEKTLNNYIERDENSIPLTEKYTPYYNLWNVLTEVGKGLGLRFLKPVRVLTDERLKALDILDKSGGLTLENFEQAYKMASVHNEAEAFFDFDWLIDEKNFRDALEGKIPVDRSGIRVC